MAAAAFAGGIPALIGSGITAGVSSSEAKKARAFQKYMVEHAYQMTMADMRAAGLNPLLAYKQGPTAMSGTVQAHVPDFGQALSSGAQAAAASKQAETKKGLAGAQGRLLNAQEMSANSAKDLNIINAEHTRLTNIPLLADEARHQETQRFNESDDGRFLNFYENYGRSTRDLSSAAGSLGGMLRGPAKKQWDKYMARQAAKIGPTAKGVGSSSNTAFDRIMSRQRSQPRMRGLGSSAVPPLGSGQGFNRNFLGP